MEMLINKEWHEVDWSKMQTRKNYYIKYTGTQQIIVGIDENGNTKMRVKKYYLSHEKVERFDSTQIGKHKNGKYIVKQGVVCKGYTEAECIQILQLDDLNMRLGNAKSHRIQQLCYIAENEIQEEMPTEGLGTIVSTQDLLVGKAWFEVDIKTKKRKRTEALYDKNGMVLYFTMAEDFKRKMPEWQMCEFYFSDNIERDFDHSKIGKRQNGLYLVVKEKSGKDNYYTANYDISTLSDNRLVLECVYPQGVPTRIFMTRQGMESSSKVNLKPQQWQLKGNVWSRLDTTDWKRSSVTEQFDSINVTRKFSVIKDGIKSIVEVSNPYYMSNIVDSVFNFNNVGKTMEGDYVVVNEKNADGDRRVVSYKIDYLNDKNMILSNISDDKESYIAYERDPSSEEQSKEELMESKKTTLDYLSGRQWRFVKPPHTSVSKWERWYYTDSLWVRADFIYDEFKKVWNTRIRTREYYLSDYAHHNFSFSQLKKKEENGKFINFFSEQVFSTLIKVNSETGRMLYAKEKAKRSYAYDIQYLSKSLFIYKTVPIVFNPNGKDYSSGKVFQYTLCSD